MVGCSFIMNITYMLQKKNSVVWLRRIGFYSLYIYVCHVMITAPTRILLNRVFHISNVPVLLVCCVVAGIIVPILVYRLAIKLNMPWMYSLEKEERTLTATKVAATKPLPVL